MIHLHKCVSKHYLTIYIYFASILGNWVNWNYMWPNWFESWYDDRSQRTDLRTNITTFGTQFIDLWLCNVSSFFCFIKFMLDFPELAKICVGLFLLRRRISSSVIIAWTDLSAKMWYLVQYLQLPLQPSCKPWLLAEACQLDLADEPDSCDLPQSFKTSDSKKIVFDVWKCFRNIFYRCIHK